MRSERERKELIDRVISVFQGESNLNEDDISTVVKIVTMVVDIMGLDSKHDRYMDT